MADQIRNTPQSVAMIAEPLNIASIIEIGRLSLMVGSTNMSVIFKIAGTSSLFPKKETIDRFSFRACSSKALLISPSPAIST